MALLNRRGVDKLATVERMNITSAGGKRIKERSNKEWKCPSHIGVRRPEDANITELQSASFSRRGS